MLLVEATMASTLKLALFFIFPSFFLLSAALDMSIIAYDDNHNMTLPRSDDEVKVLYESWLVEHGKVYNGIGTKLRRFEIFKDNLRVIDEHNSAGHQYKIGLNQFADITNEEYRSMLLSPKTQLGNRKTSDRYAFKVGDELPESVDWRRKGAVGPVKDQGSCGSSWAFSAVGAVEGANKIGTGNFVALSEQELLDCDLVDNGCRGGIADQAFEFIIGNGGIATMARYPYRGCSGYCDPNQKNIRVVSIDEYEDIPVNDEKSLKKAVANQPVSVVVDARSINFQFYRSGIYNGPCGSDPNQGAVAVGYGTERDKDYWILKNSWGNKWGEGGYIRLERDISDTPSGKCGVATGASYPVKNSTA